MSGSVDVVEVDGLDLGRDRAVDAEDDGAQADTRGVVDQED